MDYEKRRQQITELRKRGESLAEIGKKYNITKQRVDQIVNKVLTGCDFVREKVRIRDKHTCQNCGKRWKKGQRRLDVHHLNGLCGKLSRTYDKVDSMNCLITLCHKCHMNLDEVRHKISVKGSPRVK